MSEEKKRLNGVAKDEKTSTEISHPGFDLKNYIKDYAGQTKIKRLIYIARVCPTVRVAAYRSAITELRKGRDTELYTQTVAEAREMVGNNLGDKWGFDKSWCESRRREYNEKEIALEHKLAEHRREEDTTEEIMAALKAYVEYLQESGNFREAQTKLRENQDYFRIEEDKLYRHVCEMENSVHLDLNDSRMSHHYGKFPKWSRRLESQYGTRKALEAKLHAINGLYCLSRGQFDSAAHRFKLVSFEIDCPTIISKRDVAIYGTLCAMASFQRAQLKTNLLKSGEFKKFMLLVPGLTDMVQNFIQCKFRLAFAQLEQMKPDIQLDYYMAKHQSRLFEKIHELAVVQYFAPFSHAKISRMATVFGVSDAEMEKTLVTLIGREAVKARIDNFNKVVISVDRNSRFETYRKALDTGAAYVQDLKNLLLRMSLQENDLLVQLTGRTQEKKRMEEVGVL
mmetsp:Transcript_19362/g.47362  ORF Transcript_19362/g.47362 Transcript_19362/m.47362 type:complete len:453 (-) Transcript_19362:229-1587(-)